MAKMIYKDPEEYSDAELKNLSAKALYEITHIKPGKRRKDGLLVHRSSIMLPNGTIMSKDFYGSDTIEIFRKIRKWEAEQAKIATCGITWVDAGSILLENAAKKSESWQRSLTTNCEAVYDGFGADSYPSQLTQGDLEVWVDSLARSKNLCAGTLRRKIATAHKMWITAKRRKPTGVVFEDLVWSDLIPDTVRKDGRRDAPSIDVIRTIVTEDDACMIPRILLFTGCRPGEMAALQRCDFDLKHKTVSISKSAEYLGGYAPRVKCTKNGKTRVIPLLAQLESLLADWLATAEPDDFLIGGKAPLPRNQILNQWDNYWIRRGAKVRYRTTKKSRYRIVDAPCTMYGLRHAYVSYIISDTDISTKYRALLVGHTPEVQQAVYDHPVDYQAENAREKVREYGEKFLENAKKSVNNQ